MQTPNGVLYKLHMVSFHSALMRCFPLGNFLTIPLHFWQVGVTQIFQLVLGNESPVPEEHKKTVGSVIEALVEISEGVQNVRF